jgi:hypothetical protein
MPLKFKMLVDSTLEKKAVAGTIVYTCVKPDYGIASGDTRALGYQVMSMTLNEDGDYPSFSVARHDMERIEDD